MILLVVLVPNLVLLLCFILGAAYGPRFPLRWWLLRLGLVPAICFGLVGYLYLTPSPLPLDYDPAIHGNPGRWDFLAAMAYGFVLPLAWLAIALPASLAYAIWRRRS